VIPETGCAGKTGTIVAIVLLINIQAWRGEKGGGRSERSLYLRKLKVGNERFLMASMNESFVIFYK
jgi:hypothetical protein